MSVEYEQAHRKRIIEGATQVFADYGYRQTTIDQIGQALQISKGAIYIYFKSKEELFVSTLRAIFERRFAILSSAYREDDPIGAKFQKILDCLGSLVTQNDYAYIRLSLEGFLESDRIPGLQAIKTESYQRFYKLLHELLQEGQLAGEINPDLNLTSMTVVLIAVADGLMMQSLVQGRGIDPDRVRHVVNETFSHVLGSRPGKSSST
ncbi:MAG: TetR/AcrR family transcriptional regulator [Spirochaetia bacterium]